jgi:hypothetical protein
MRTGSDGCRRAETSHGVLILVVMQPARLLERILGGDVANVDFADAQRLVKRLGFEELRVTGSHHVYARPRDR